MESRSEGSSRSTIRDVARVAGVSIATVSQAFGGRRPISDKTRQRVLAAAAELGYTADPSARSLRTRRSGMVGIILRPRDAAGGVHGGAETFPRLTGAVAMEALGRGIGLVHVPDVLDPDAARVPMDGCIVAFPNAHDVVVTELQTLGVPVVLADVDPGRPDFTWAVRLRHAEVMRALLDGLWEQGARSVVLVGGTEDNHWNRSTREAFEAWATAHAMAPRVIPLFEGEGVAGGERAVGALLDAPDRPDAVIGGTSRVAVGAVNAAVARGLGVPGDLLVAGLTDGRQTREHHPGITAIDLRLEDLGQMSMDLLMARLEGAAQPPAPLELVPTLTWRESTGSSAGLVGLGAARSE